jgi:hypothetical protein
MLLRDPLCSVSIKFLIIPVNIAVDVDSGQAHHIRSRSWKDKLALRYISRTFSPGNRSVSKDF